MNLWHGKHALLVRRELWEHRTLWLAPAVVALLILVIAMFGNLTLGASGLTVTRPDVPPEMQSYIARMTLAALAGVLGVVACIVSLVYLLDCLFAERRDRSILFWKSLPVSDAATVLTKLGVVLLVVPVLTLALALLTYGLLSGLLYLRYEHLRPAFDLAHVARGFTALPQLASSWLITLLWFAPVATYLMLASVLAKRAPLVYAVLPPVVLILVEQLLFDTNRVGSFLARWLLPWARMPPGADWQDRAAFRGPDWLVLLRDPDLWLGLAAAAVMVYMVIRLRRYRDDT